MAKTLNTNTLLDRMAHDLNLYLDKRQIKKPLMVGIHTGGVWVAQALHSRLGLKEPLGTLNISFYRDDFTRKGLHPHVMPSALPFDVDSEHIILVDDVVQTGRTIRAALNELYDYGRPESITLVALVERPQRELPIRADIVGESLAHAKNEWVKLSGPEPLTLEIRQKTHTGG